MARQLCFDFRSGHLRSQGKPADHAFVGQGHDLAEHIIGGCIEAHVVAIGFRHLAAIGAKLPNHEGVNETLQGEGQHGNANGPRKSHDLPARAWEGVGHASGGRVNMVRSGLRAWLRACCQRVAACGSVALRRLSRAREHT